MTGSRHERIRFAFGIAAILVAAAAVAVSLAIYAVAVMASGKPLFGDWTVYSDSAQRFLSGGSLYAQVQLDGPYLPWQSSREGYLYPPPSILLFLPFATGTAGMIGWVTLNAGLFMAGLAAVVRHELGRGWLFPFAFVLLGLTLYVPLHVGLTAANASVGVAGLYAFAWARRDRPGAWAGIGAVVALLKVTPGLLAVFAARRGGPRVLIAAAGVAIGISVVTLPLFGLDSWRDFFVSLSNVVPACIEGRFGPVCTLEPLLGAGGAKAIAALIGLALALAALRVRSERLAFVLIGAAILAPSPDLQVHYWLIAYVAFILVAVVPIARTVQRWRARQGAGRTTSAPGPS